MDDFTSPDESLSTGKGGQWGEPGGPVGCGGSLRPLILTV